MLALRLLAMHSAALLDADVDRRRASTEEESMQRLPPDPEALARRLLTHEVGEHPTSEAVEAAAALAYVQLPERLSVVLGPTGFDALWARAMLLARQQLHAAGIEGDLALQIPPHGVPVAVRGRDSSEAHDLVIAAFASFIALLFTFIGAELGFRLLRQVWPELPLDAPATADRRSSQ